MPHERKPTYRITKCVDQDCKGDLKGFNTSTRICLKCNSMWSETLSETAAQSLVNFYGDEAWESMEKASP